ncbi:FAD-dependent oxidoreductase [Streptomyces sodiiphilus]|uniref:FAD-dependent oxidoreductase n=1 Tax=Streptomyces sodiiphilus TaxID=226217 RepID=A0ABP5AJ49_9ACTN
MTGRVLIVGAGPVAHRLAGRLAALGHGDGTVLLGAEPHPPYHRSLLTRLLRPGTEPRLLAMPPLPPGTEIRARVRVRSLDRHRRRVLTDAGEAVGYDTLVLATGARPRLPGPQELSGLRTEGGRLLPGAGPLRTLRDAAETSGRRVVVLGAGPLGVEAAAALRRAGRETVLVHRGPHPLSGHLDAAAGELLARALTAQGIGLETGRTAVSAVPGKLTLDDGRVLAWDRLLLCTGAQPRTELAAEAGIRVRRGIVVDALLRTGDPRIHAIGDCAEPEGGHTGSLEEGWSQADALARTLAGRPTAFHPPAPLLRLRHGADVAVLHPAPGAGTGVRRVTFRDRTRGRYARLDLDAAGRLVSAVTVGLPEAPAALSQLHDTRMPVPADPLPLLLGAPARSTTEEVRLPQAALICRCNNVPRRQLDQAWQQGARTVEALAAATRATTGCGTCTDQVRRICSQLDAASKTAR